MSPVFEITYAELERENSQNLLKLFFEHKILVVRNNQGLGLSEIKHICELFGQLYSNSDDSPYLVGNELTVLRVANSTEKKSGLFHNYSLNWHNDFSHTPGEYHGTGLYNAKGGECIDTRFADIEKAFRDLPDNIIQKYADLWLAHAPRLESFRELNLSVAEKRLLRQKKCKVYGHFSHDCFHSESTTRPLFPAHPSTKKRSLYLSPATVDREPIDEVYEELLNYCMKYTFSFQWQPYDLLLFDNLSVMHSRGSFSGDRTLYRLQFDYTERV